MEAKRISPKVAAFIIFICCLWGANMAAVKLTNTWLSPLFMAGVRSLFAALCLYILMKIKGIKLFPSRIIVLHGIVTGLLFGAEFGIMYVGLTETLASRGYIFQYTHAFWVALGAHFFLDHDKLSGAKLLGLGLAFGGVLTLFGGGLVSGSLETLAGDSLLLVSGFLWAATTLYIKRFLAGKAKAMQVLFYQLLFSMPLLFVFSFIFEDQPIMTFGYLPLFALLYQTVIVAFISYVVWFMLIERYPVSVLSAFTFFTPVLGVLISGVLILGEPLTLSLVIALLMVTGGIWLVNRA
jgi:drug/metabolite transporter (DMT)-like permease